MVEAKLERDGLVLWTDGSRKEDESVGCAVVWEEDGRWKKRRVHLGRQKEAFDAEISSAKSEIGFRKWTPRTDPSPHSPQIIRVTYLQSSTMLRSV